MGRSQFIRNESPGRRIVGVRVARARPSGTVLMDSNSFHAADRKVTLVTTSWDDGDRSDLRLAELLRSRGIGGTFYVPILPYNGRTSLTPADLRTLSSEGFEIGAHGFSHKLLWGLSVKELASEIDPCKPRLEQILGSEVQMFCYPRGRYNTNVVHALRGAGYRGARTVQMLSTELSFRPFEMPTTLQVFPHRISGYLKNVTRSRMKGLGVCLTYGAKLTDWLDLGKAIFDTVLESGGVWHLYGHSWEIEQLGLWDHLAELLDHVSGRKEVTYLSNGELLEFRHSGGFSGQMRLSSKGNCPESHIHSSSGLS